MDAGSVRKSTMGDAGEVVEGRKMRRIHQKIFLAVVGIFGK